MIRDTWKVDKTILEQVIDFLNNLGDDEGEMWAKDLKKEIEISKHPRIYFENGKKVYPDRDCLICGATMKNPRPDRKTCSNSCRRELCRRKLKR